METVSLDADLDGICDPFEIPGCTDSSAFNFDTDATDDNGSCIAIVNGCTDQSGCNYNPSANTEDGTCEFTSCIGCLSSAACNYDPTAIYPGECSYPDEGYDCNGDCLFDTDEDGTCDPFEIYGCTQENSLNFDPVATENDGSCIIIVEGCTDNTACNFNNDANVENNSCDYISCVGCMNISACNFDPVATIGGECIFPDFGYNCSGDCEGDSDGDGICDPFEIPGCSDTTACNFNPDATDNDGSCIYPLNEYDCFGNCVSDQDNDGICDGLESAPELIIPSDISIECDVTYEGNPTASGGCSEPEITYSDINIPGFCPNTFTIVRVYTASDNCGNQTSESQIVSVSDTTPPVLTIPADYTAECSDAHPMDDASATDNCGEVTINLVETTIPGLCAGDYTITRAFTATDDCGNATSATQTITIIDTTAPVLTIPADYTAECSDAHPMDDASATDNCGEVTISVVETTTDGACAGDYSIARTWTATDDCGNATSATQTITIIDTTAPEFTSIPADYTAECSDDHPMDDASATDNCGEVTIDVVETTIAGACAGDYTIYTYVYRY